MGSLWSHPASGFQREKSVARLHWRQPKRHLGCTFELQKLLRATGLEPRAVNQAPSLQHFAACFNVFQLFVFPLESTAGTIAVTASFAWGKRAQRLYRRKAPVRFHVNGSCCWSLQALEQSSSAWILILIVGIYCTHLRSFKYVCVCLIIHSFIYIVHIPTRNCFKHIFCLPAPNHATLTWWL